MRAHGLTALAVAAAALLAVPAGAGAATICVGASGPGCDPAPGLQAALDTAAETSTGDRVVLGPGLYEGPFGYLPGGGGGAIEVVGQGPSTVLTAPAGSAPATVLNLVPDTAGDGSTASNLTVRIPANSNDTADTGIYAQSAANVRVASDAHEVSTPSASAPVGIYLAPGGAVRNSVVELVGGGGGGIGVLASGPAGTATVVADSRIMAPLGVKAAGQPTAVVRARIYPAGLGVLACNAEVTVEDTLIRLSGALAVGVEARGDEQCGQGQGSVTARQMTIVGTGEGVHLGANAVAGVAGQHPAIDISLSVMRSLSEATAARAGPASSASVSIGASDFEAARHLEEDNGGTASFLQPVPNIDADPLFAEPLLGDFTLSHGSPAIDSVYSPPLAPDESTTDLSGNPRVLDGDGDGVAARDMGAFEAPAVPPPAPPPDRTPPDTRIILAKKKSRKRPTAGPHGYAFHVAFASSEPGSTFQCRLDTGRFERCSSPFRARLTAGMHRFQVRAVDAAGNVDPTPAGERIQVAGPHRRPHRHHRHRPF